MRLILISHRGNLTGPNPENENRPEYLTQAARLGFLVEADIWHSDGKFFLGHDEPTYPVDPEFIQTNQALIFHAKDFHTAIELAKFGSEAHWFSHAEDDMTFTSRGWPWVHPRWLGCNFPGAIIVAKSRNFEPSGIAVRGFCGDYVMDWKTDWEKLGC